MTDVEMRLVALERQNRWFRRGAAVLALGAAGAGLMAATGDDHLRTRNLAIVDEYGKTRATFGTVNGGVGLVLLGNDEKTAMSLVALANNTTSLSIRKDG